MASWSQAFPKSPGWKGSTTTTLLLIFTFVLLASGTIGPKVVSLPLYRNEERSIVKRSSAGVPIDYYALSGGSYWLNASVGTPPQLVQLVVDTGSSDVWVFGPGSCDRNHCLGPVCKSL